MARWGGDVKPSKTAYNNEQAVAIKPKEVSSTATVYADSPTDLNFITLQNNLETCLSIVENEVMKNYVSSLQRCHVVPLKDENLKELQQIQFFKITQLVYQEDEFSVHKLATVLCCP